VQATPRARIDRRALVAIALCAALPVVIGVLLTSGPVEPVPSAAHPSGGHWVYVPGRGVAVHVNGTAKRVDATVPVGAASAGSPVVADRRSAYLVDDDRVLEFGRSGVTGSRQAAGIAEHPVPVEARGVAYLVYRTAGLIVRLGGRTVTAGGPLGDPIVAPDGHVWVYRVDSGALCRVDGAGLLCPGQVPAGHTGALAVLAGRPGFVDVTAGRWVPLEGGSPVTFGVPLPANALVGAVAVAGRLAIIDPAARKLLLVGGSTVSVPLGDGRLGVPVSTGTAAAVLTGETLTSYDASGHRRAEVTVPGGLSLTLGPDNRAYADSPDGLQTVVMDPDGTLTVVPTTGDTPPSYQSPAATPTAAPPPATVAATTTETIPPEPETVTVPGPPPSTTTQPPPGDPPPAPPPGPPSGPPTIDVVSASSPGPGEAMVKFTVSGTGPVFCHVFFNSVERAAAQCEGTMQVDVKGLSPNTKYDIYVLGTNAAGTGTPGHRGLLQT
jgi:hypothetical protein